MPWILEVLLQVNRGIAKCPRGLLPGELQGVVKVGFGIHHAHAAPTPAGRRLDDDRVTDPPRNLRALRRFVRQRAIGTGHTWDAGLPHGLDRRYFVAHQADGLRARPDENEPALLDALGEIGVFRKESVAWMNRNRVSDLGGRDDSRHIEVALGGRRRSDADGFVRHGNVLEIAIDRRMNGHRLDTHRMAGAEDTQSDLTAIGNDDLFQGGHGGRVSEPRRGAGRTRPAGRSRPGSPPPFRIFRPRSG